MENLNDRSFNDRSFYNWPDFTDKEKEYNSEIICGILEDYFRIQDWFISYNEFINHDNQEKNYINHVEGKLNGINIIFKIGRINKEEHKEELEKLIFNMSSNTLAQINPKERAKIVCHSLKKEILTLKEDFSK